MSKAMLTKQQDSNRAKIAATQRRRAEVENARQAPAEVSEVIRATLVKQEAERARVLRYQLAALGAGEYAEPFTVRAAGSTARVDVGDVLVGLLGVDRMMELLQPHLDTLPDGLTAEQRRQQLAEIDAELLALGHAEMDLIEQCEAEGVPFTWRANMDPAIVLRLARQ